MADRFWVNGAGSWNSTARWSTTSGGTSGASVPTAADNVIFDGNSGTSHFTVTVTAGATCANFTISPEPIVGVTQFAIDNTFVIAGTFTTNATAGNRRVWFRSSTYGLVRDMSIAAVGSVIDADFRDVRVTGPVAPISGTRVGNLGGCSGITFNAPKTVYWNLAAGGNWSADAWAASSGGAVSTDNFPLAQDTAVIENTGLNTSATVTLDTAIPYFGTVNMSTRTNAMTFATSSTAASIYGSWTNGSGTTLSGTGTLTFAGRLTTQTITSAGKTFTQPITIDAYGSTVQLADALTHSGNSFQVINGTFSTQNFNFTAPSFASDTSNVRTINLGSSTVTLSGSPSAFGIATNTNLTFNAGTSTITITNAGTFLTGTTGGAGLTFHNVVYTGGTSTATSILSANTFNNLTLTAPASVGQTVYAFSTVQTINGTLTVAGATPTRRVFLRSSTFGTIRTLTVNSLSATDCDFRDITIAGTAAGSSPTRAGNCGGNTGITFPTPKTVYWNLAGTQNWSADGWALSSGGTPATNNFPLAQDTVVFDNAGAAGTVTIDQAWNIGTFDASLRTTAMTLTNSAATTIYGDWRFGTGVTSGSNGNPFTFSKQGTATITSNGVTFESPITIACGAGGTVQLANALTLASNRTLLLTSGTFDAVTYNVTVGLFDCTTTTNTVLRMGSGTWTLSGTGAVWFDTASAGSFVKGTANIVLSSTSTFARIFRGQGRAYNRLTIGGTTGTSTLTITGNNDFSELASTKTVAHTIALGTTAQTFGAWTVTGTVGNVVTVTGTGTDHVIAGSRVSGVNYLAMGTNGFSASPGEFYAGPNSTGTGANVILTAAPTPVTRYWVGGTGTWDNTTTNWSATSGGPGGASVPTSADEVIFNAASSATTYTVTRATTGIQRCNSLTITAPASGTLTLAGLQQIIIHGNVTLPATGFAWTNTALLRLSGSTTGKTLTTNGVALPCSVVITGEGCGWTLGSSLTLTSEAGLSISKGSFSTANFNVAAFQLSGLGTGTKTITLGSSLVSLSSGLTAAQLSFDATNTTFNAGTSTIELLRATTVTLNCAGLTFHNVSISAQDAVTLNPQNTATSTATFNNLTLLGRTTPGVKIVQISAVGSANIVVNGTLTFSAGANATCRTFVRSDPLGTARTMTCAAVSATDTDFRDITIAGAAAPASGTRLGNAGGNSGITFTAAKTVYWNLAGSNNWSATAWATSAGGTPAVNNFPLAQDTAIFTATSPASGDTITLDAAAYAIGTIDMSARTANTMTLTTVASSIYGNWINGTGITLTGTGALTFSRRGSQTLTSAGLSFPQAIIIDSPGGSVVLQDAFVLSSTATNPLTLTRGTFDANGYNVTISSGGSGGVSFSTTETRAFALGSGTWTLANSGVIWSGNTINFTLTGTATINCTSASAKTFQGSGISYTGVTLNQGGAGTLTITSNNIFANISNTFKATGATNITLGTTTQRVANFTASGEVGRVLTVQGTSVSSPATLIYTGTGTATKPATNYLTVLGVRAYALTDTWYAGANSTNSSSLGWIFSANPASASSIYYGAANITAIFYGSTPVSAIYYGAAQVF